MIQAQPTFNENSDTYANPETREDLFNQRQMMQIATISAQLNKSSARNCRYDGVEDQTNEENVGDSFDWSFFNLIT